MKKALRGANSAFLCLCMLAIFSTGLANAQVIYLGASHHNSMGKDRNEHSGKVGNNERLNRPDTPGASNRPEIVIPSDDDDQNNEDAIERPNVWAFYSPRAVVQGTIERASGTTFSLLGGEVIVDASKAKIQYPWWWKYYQEVDDATDAADEAPVIMPGLKVKVTGVATNEGTFNASHVRLYEPAGDGSISGLIQRASAEAKIFVIADEQIFYDDDTVFLHRKHRFAASISDSTEPIKVGEYVTAIVDVETTDPPVEGEEVAAPETFLKAKFVFVSKRADVRRMRP